MPDAWDRDSDASLMERTRSGDEAALLQLYQRHRDPTFHFAYRMLGSAEQAEDVTHDCFLSLIRSPGRFDPRRGSLRAYLYAAARNLVLKRFRRSLNEVAGENLGEKAHAAVPEEPLRHLLAEELSGEVRKALAQMSPLQREVIVLFEYEEQSLAEIASIVGTDVGTVKSRLHRGRECLRRELAPYLNGAGGKRREKSDHE
jgi:RNA polymerase sigma-70 factor (ECF subfamily)